VKISDTHRIGGLITKFGASGWLLYVIKQEEAYYADSLQESSDDKRHITQSPCIIDKKWIEKVNFGLDSPHPTPTAGAMKNAIKTPTTSCHGRRRTKHSK
jgi:hypothetical protein